MRRNVALTDILQTIGANVRRRRERLGLTQEALAEAADLDLSFVQRVERGETNVSVAVLVRIAGVLGLRPALLFRAARIPEIKRGRPKKRTKS